MMGRVAELDWITEYEDSQRSMREQHGELHARLNDAFLALTERKARSEIMSAMTAVETTLRSHLEYEEGLMFRYRYSKASEHAKSHEEILKRFERITDEVREPETRSKGSTGLTSLFFELFNDHLVNHDEPLALFLRERGEA